MVWNAQTHQSDSIVLLEVFDTLFWKKQNIQNWLVVLNHLKHIIYCLNFNINSNRLENPPTLPSLGRGRAAPGTTKSTKATPIALAVPHLSSPIMATVASQVEHSKGDSGQPGPGQQLYGFRKRRMAPRPCKASPRLSRTSLRPAMAPQWPARPRTAVIWLPKATDGTAARPRTTIIWLPKATDGTSPLKGFAAPEPIFPPMATVASQAQDSNYMVSATDGTSALKGLAAPEPDQSYWPQWPARPRTAVRDSESDGWHLGLARLRRTWAGPVFVQQWRHSGQPGPGQQLYGFRKRRMAPWPWKASPRLSRTVATVATPHAITPPALWIILSEIGPQTAQSHLWTWNLPTACRALLSWRLGMLDANTPPWSRGPNQSLAVRAFVRMVSRFLDFSCFNIKSVPADAAVVYLPCLHIACNVAPAKRAHIVVYFPGKFAVPNARTSHRAGLWGRKPQ